MLSRGEYLTLCSSWLHKFQPNWKREIFRGIVHLTCSKDAIAEVSDTTFASLQSKHLAPNPDSNMPLPPNHIELEEVLLVEEEDLIRVIRSLPNGSAVGPNGLKPQHLVDLTSFSAGQDRDAVLHALTIFTNFILAGNTLAQARGIYFEASLTALSKDGGVRVIVVGSIIRRLIAKSSESGGDEAHGPHACTTSAGVCNTPCSRSCCLRS